ncbi:MAG: alanyl-tRNA editing protein [Vicinamibacterales bacterium]
MTNRIYYTEPCVQTFEATVERCELVEIGARVVLDRTAFYPTSGGQPHDTGTLGGRRVIDVVDTDGDGVLHLIDGPLTVGANVRGDINWPRRFEHMQQHTGQHVLSAAFERLAGARTESFHLGPLTATIDLAREVTMHEIAAAEEEANRVVWEDRAVTIRFVDADAAAKLPLRKDPTRAGMLRLIEIDELDLSACGGTHVSRTGGVGIIAVTGWEKFRGGTRVEFVCGVRASARFRLWRDAISATLRHLSVAPEELAGAVERLQNDNKSLARTARGLQERLAVHEGRTLAERGMRVGSRLAIVETLDGWDATALKALAVAAAQQPGAAVVLFSASSPALVVVASHRDADIDAGAILKALVTKFGGKGGGKPDLAQGGGLVGSAADLVAVARDLLETDRVA